MPRPLPHPVRRVVDELLRAPIADPDDLRRRVGAHLEQARAAAADQPLIDLDRAEGVARTCLVLLDAWTALHAGDRAWVQVACLYFARTHDDEDDFASIVGFDDDLDVLHHTLDQIGRPDLRQEP